MPDSPIESEGARRDELALLAALIFVSGRHRIAATLARVLPYFPRLQSRPDIVETAIKQGSSLVLIRSAWWSKAYSELVRDLSTAETALYRRGLRTGLAEVRSNASRLIAQIPDLAQKIGSRKAVKLAQALDRATRRNLVRMIDNASRSYTRNPSLNLLRELRAGIMPKIGLTPKQARRIETYARAARGAGIEADVIAAEVKRRTARQIELRARAIADRGMIESISEARHRGWVAAEKAGLLPDAIMKAWQDQGDNRVRPTHSLQTSMGPIPLHDVYPVFGVLHPPAPEMGCRCWDVIYYPPGVG